MWRWSPERIARHVASGRATTAEAHHTTPCAMSLSHEEPCRNQRRIQPEKMGLRKALAELAAFRRRLLVDLADAPTVVSRFGAFAIIPSSRSSDKPPRSDGDHGAHKPPDARRHDDDDTAGRQTE